MRFLFTSFIFHFGDDFHCFDANGRYPPHQIRHILFIIRKTVGIKLLPDSGVFGLAFFVAVKHPFDGRAVAQFVIPGLGRDAAERGSRVQLDDAVGFVSFEAGSVWFAAGIGVDVGARQRVGGDGFVVQVQGHELLAPGRPLPEVVVEGDAREVAFEVELVFFAVGGMVQDGVDVVEDVLFGEGLVGRNRVFGKNPVSEARIFI